MPFLSPEISGYEQKQHLNLSRLAYEVIESDRDVFGAQPLAGFINRIFANFRDTANASIGLALQRRQAEWEETLSGMEADAKKQAIQNLSQKYQQELIKMAFAHQKGHAFAFRINKKNYQYLTADELCSEEKFYGDKGIGKYLKALLEEYACKPFLEREQIALKPTFDIINGAIQNKKQLQLRLLNGSQVFIRPYQIMTDPLSMYHYLIGYEETANRTDPETQLCSFSYRIANLRMVKEIYRSGFLSKHQQDVLLREVHEKGAQFLLTGAEEIRVQLTPAGIQKYNRLLHLRPNYTSKQADIYSFSCTSTQIEYYFFKFGADAKILSPDSLAEKFEKMYRDAIDRYTMES